ncbi:M36 family metallopeptidase [Ulvibacter antarcticus]|uniref:Putative secreted protein (Por secretion system target) n=1 Tax=Ulvibacter antarcticus TaxID=442714 RepID=A0A3L9Z001_9FLAO|nr:M36 family metallopeptidase [Ulvibacter antarcticus]RMA64689.1 putative secreted protein (Por secretion system target) [Ulvibacter antarcticus]
MKKLTLSLLFCMVTLLSANLFAQNFSQNITLEIQKLVDKSDLLAADAQWEITSQHTSSISGVHHIYYRQLVNGVQVYGTESGVHIASNGKVIAANNRFINKTADKLSNSVASLSASEAVQAAANQLNYNLTQSLAVISRDNGLSQKTLLSDGGISLSEIPAELVYTLNEENKLVLSWDLSIQEKSQKNWWSMRVDASTGTIIDKNDYMVSCGFDHDHSEDTSELNYNTNLYDVPNYEAVSVENEMGCVECYEVFKLPLESPYYGTRTIEVLPANATASPYGWHDTDGAAGAEFTVTRGNNANAYEDGNNSGYQPDGGTDLNFTGYPFSEIYSGANQYEDAAISHLFYMNNSFHDIIYTYGFDEVSGNFQEMNYTGLGAGSDSVNAEAQDGSGTCNANFGTPPDGSNPTMQMYVCGDKDGDFDNLVIIHEYAHGISNRLTGGPTNTGCLNNSEQMGEGWGDFLGAVLSIEPGAVGEDPRGVGTYLFGQGIGGPGIRDYPYSTDFSVDPQTYDYIKTAAVPHGVGSVWATILWEMTWTLIDEHGYDDDFFDFTGDVNTDAGNVQAFALVMEGMKLQPCSPGFVDGRDAIFAADQAIYGGANECLLWEAFAIRGLGYSADQGSSGSRSDGTEAFDMPITSLNTADEVCVGEGVQTYGGGSPSGGVYSGPGVTDDGNGLSYTFDPAVAGIGTHTITYDAVSLCSTTSQDTDTIEVTDDIPEIVCQDVTLELDINGEATLTQYDVVTNLEPGALVVDQTGTFAPIDISATGTSVSLSDDDVSNALAIGFDFSFYETVYTNFFISSNGFISFDASVDDGCCSGELLPLPSDADNIIAMAWEDLNPSSGGTIRYETVGTAPDRKLIVEFDGVPFYASSDAVTSQIHLFEGSNRIEIHSTLIPSNGNTTQGIENQDGTMGLPTPGRNSSVWSAANDYVAYYYSPGGPADNCGASATITMSQTLFTCDDFGPNVITVTVTDTNGNSADCTPTITVTDPLTVCNLGINDNEFNQNVSLYPNPTNGQITMVNTSNYVIRSATITDVNGRTVQILNVDDATQTSFSIASLAQGMYFVKIEADDATIVKRIVKQ